MKELSIEEKAKRYESALEKCRKLYKEAKANEYTSDIEDYETIFPELRESEDERTRKEIVGYLKKNLRLEWATWLEKQGEKDKDVRCKYLDELLYADDIYQMAMNDAMVEEAKTKAMNALSELEIGKLLGIEKHWKPSDVQMQVLKEACDKRWEPDGLDPLYTLYE